MISKSFLAVVSAIIFAGFVNVQAQNGFVVWAKGGGCNRELHYNKLENGKVGAEQLAVKKGPGADVWVHISYDGVWIAWSRAMSAFKGKYGQCDYHSFQKFDIYIAKIDNGKATMPLTPIKIDHGYYPSWGEDATHPSKPKTLYFTHYESQSIKKTTVSPDGKFTAPVEFNKVPQQGWGTNAHIQMSPGGRYLAYRPERIHIWDYEQNKRINCTPPKDGCHPAWGPRSTYLIWASNHVCRVDDGVYTYLKRSASLGKYWYGFSNDAYFDEGKLWIIGSPGCGQNGAGKTQFKEVDISNKGWKVGAGTVVGTGNSADIHVWGPDGPPREEEPTPVLPRNKLNSDLNFDTRITVGTVGLHLIIESIEPTTLYSAGLYDMQGTQKAFIGNLSEAKTVIPMQGIANGVYMLMINTDKGTTQKTIRLVR